MGLKNTDFAYKGRSSGNVLSIICKTRPWNKYMVSENVRICSACMSFKRGTCQRLKSCCVLSRKEVQWQLQQDPRKNRDLVATGWSPLQCAPSLPQCALLGHAVVWSSPQILHSGLHALIGIFNHVPLPLTCESLKMNSYSYFFLLWLFHSCHYKEQLAQWALICKTHAYGECWLLIEEV